MADLIDRDELRKDFCNMCEAMQPEMIDCEKKGCMSMQIIGEQTAANRWISCAEQLPERETDVLVYIPVWEENPIQVAYLMYDGIIWELSDGEFNFGKREVLYWMPLPNKPEVKSNDA
jgi:hypothetical protein